MIETFRRYMALRRARREEGRFLEGHDWAAGILLRGHRAGLVTPDSLRRDIQAGIWGAPDAFDRGALGACRDFHVLTHPQDFPPVAVIEAMAEAAGPANLAAPVTATEATMEEFKSAMAGTAESANLAGPFPAHVRLILDQPRRVERDRALRELRVASPNLGRKPAREEND